MQPRQAVEKAEKDENVRKLHGYYLGSCFACIKDKNEKINEWTLLYYNPKKKIAADCFVNDKFVTLSNGTRPLNEVEKMDMDAVKTGIEHALETAAGKFGKKTINILITLHRKERMLWTINFIGQDLQATTFDVDAENGKVLREETISLARKI